MMTAAAGRCGLWPNTATTPHTLRPEERPKKEAKEAGDAQN